MAEPATGRAQAPGAVDRENPFQGLEYYTEADAEWFFGRTTDRKVIIAHLRTARLTVLYAESGVGKSSLLRAGVAARLREVATRSIEERGYPRFLPVVFKAWKDDPVRDLIATIRAQTRPFAERMRELGISPPQLGAGRWEPPLDAERFTATDGDRSGHPLPDNELASSIEETTGALGGTLVIMLDQFEEHFGYRVGQEHPERLADQLARCINARDVPANFLIAVREDSYGKIGDLFRGRIGNVYRNYLRLDYLRRESAREAIEGPVRVYNSLHEGQRVQIGPGLVDAVLDEVRRGNLTLAAGTEERGSSEAGKDEIETPFLQLIMKRLWEYELGNGSQVLRKETLDDDLGGAQSIVNSHFSRALRDLSPQEVEMAGAIFADLVTPSGAKIAHTASDLADRTAQSEDAVRAVLEKLDAERIVRAVESAPGSRESRYEIFHDRLAAPILEWRKQQEKARLEREKRQAEEEAQQERNQARRFRRLATVVGVLAAGCIIALVAALLLWRYASDQKQAAVNQANSAASLALASTAQVDAGTRPDVALSLALAAYRMRPGGAAASSVIASLEAFRRTGAVAVLHGHSDTVYPVAFSPDGRLLASGSSDTTIRLWSVQTHEQSGSPLEGRGTTGVVSLDFSRDGRTLASAGGFDRTVRLWNVTSHRQIGPPLKVDDVYAYSVAFSPDGRMFASAGFHRHITLWDARTRQEIGPPFRCRCKAVTSVAFSPDGRALASAGYDGTVRLWSVATHRELARQGGYPGTIYAIAFRRDGRALAYSGTDGTVRVWYPGARTQSGKPLRGHSAAVSSLAFGTGAELASGGADGSVRMWDIDHHREVGRPLTGHAGTVLGVAFSPDGRTLASAGTDGTIRLWNARAQHRLGDPLSSHTGEVHSVAVNLGGGDVASANGDGEAMVWDAHTFRLIGHPLTDPRAPILSVAFTPNGRTLAAGDGRGDISLWQVGTGSKPMTLAGQRSAVNSVAFSPSGRILASAADDGVVTLWDPATGHLVAHLPTGTGPVHSVAFSPDGGFLAAGGDNKIWLFDARSHSALSQLRGLRHPVNAVAFSPDGRMLASAGDEKILRLWNALTGAQIGELSGGTGATYGIAFSPDGRILASGGSDNAIRLWTIATRSGLGPPLTGHSGIVDSVAFTHDGRTLLSGSRDGTLRVWDGIFWHSLTDLRAGVCSLIGTGLSQTEWAQFAGGIRYRQSCAAS